MTLASHELVELGVSESVIAWRKWRRARSLTIPEAAAMAGMDGHYLQRIEVGKVKLSQRIEARLGALMLRWDESMRPPKRRRRVRR